MPAQCKFKWIFSVYLTFSMRYWVCSAPFATVKSKINDLLASIQWNHFIAIIYHCVDITEISMQKNFLYRQLYHGEKDGIYRSVYINWMKCKVIHFTKWLKWLNGNIAENSRMTDSSRTEIEPKSFASIESYWISSHFRFNKLFLSPSHSLCLGALSLSIRITHATM